MPEHRSFPDHDNSAVHGSTDLHAEREGGAISRRRLLALAGAMGAAVAAARLRTAEAGVPLQVRRNAKTLSRDEWNRFVRALKAMKQLPSLYDPTMNAYDYYVQLHMDAYYDPNMPAHMAAAFAPWHRQLLLLVENDLHRTDPSVSIPYWDWTVDNTRNAYVWTSDFVGGDGDPKDRWIVKDGPFREGEWSLGVIDPVSLDQDGTIFSLQRHFGVYESAGVPTTTLPTPQDIETVLSRTVYDVAPWDDFSDPLVSFRNDLEGFRKKPDGSRLPSENHNRVHNWTGGPMTEGASNNDPVFWLHHSFIDLIWVEWQNRHGMQYQPVSGARLGQNLHDPLYRLNGQTPANLLNHRALGYIYDREIG